MLRADAPPRSGRGQTITHHVIITGGSSGIGLAVAALYAARGDRLSLIARGVEPLHAAQTFLASLPGAKAESIQIACADVSDGEALAGAIAACETRFGACDILVASAGIVEPGAFDTQAPDLFEQQIAINLMGVVHAVREVYPGMMQRRSGRIMIVSSGAALIGIHGYTAYCASKSGLHGFAEALRFEARQNDVTVSICFPPDTHTPQFVREQALRPWQARLIMGKVRPQSTEAVAARIVQAIDKGRFETFFGFTLFALGRFGSLIKPVLNRWFDRAIATSRKD